MPVKYRTLRWGLLLVSIGAYVALMGWREVASDLDLSEPAALQPAPARGLDEDCGDGLHEYCLTSVCTCRCHAED